MDITAINSTPKYRTIIVDDEPPALAKLSYLLKDYEDFELVGSFDNADDALESVREVQPQVAFLDIAMPGRNGMELASDLKSRLADNIEIIFITAFDQYAVSAFDLDATDYLLSQSAKNGFKNPFTASRILWVPCPQHRRQYRLLPLCFMRSENLRLPGRARHSRSGGPQRCGSYLRFISRTALTAFSARIFWIPSLAPFRKKKPCPISTPATITCASS